MRLLILLSLFFFMACEKQPTSITAQHEFYKCTVRVDLKWNETLTDMQRNKILEKFSMDSSSIENIERRYGIAINKHNELLHFSVFQDNHVCLDNKYERVEFVLNKYLKPLKNAPTYTIYKQPLLENEFDGLSVYPPKY